MCYKSQLDDFIYRGHDLQDYNVLRFVVDTYEEKTSQAPTSDSTNEDRRGPGRPQHKRIPYLASHSRHNNATRVIRAAGHSTLPNIIGRFIPSQRDESNRMLYCASILCLLKPWRTIEDLRKHDQSWESAWEKWQAHDATDRDRDIISNIEYFHATRNAADIDRSNSDEAVVDSEHEIVRWPRPDEEQEEDEIQCEIPTTIPSRPSTNSQQQLEQFVCSLMNTREREYASNAVGGM